MQTASDDNLKKYSIDTQRMLVEAVRLTAQKTAEHHRMQLKIQANYRKFVFFVLVMNGVFMLLYYGEFNDAHVLAKGIKQEQVKNLPSSRSNTFQSNLTAISADGEELEKNYYGQWSSRGSIKQSEDGGFIQHNSQRGGSLGQPKPPREVRVAKLVENKIPLTPKETHYIKSLLQQDEAAVFEMGDIEQRSRTVNYEMGKILELTVAKNAIATLSFIDRFGNPFAISTLSPQNAGELFTTHLVTPDGGVANTAEIRASKLVGSSNISVLLQAQTAPILFKIKLNQTVNDAQTVVRVDKVAPGFEYQSLSSGGSESQSCRGDETIESVLAGVPSSTLTQVQSNLSSVQVFRDFRSQYIRSSHQIVDPECECRIYGLDGINVCRQSQFAPVVLLVNSETEQFARLTLIDR